jgi:4-hydroxy 2-oxovalerate aldolase
MNHIKLLDCTLRDGAYLIDKKFGDIAIYGIVHGLMEAKIDIIEIGFLQNDGYGDGKVVFGNGADARKYVPEDKEECLFTVLADYSRYNINKLDNYDRKSFDAVRACFFKEERFDVLNFCREIKNKGYKLFVQPVDILGYSDFEIIDFINRINEIEPHCFSIVDTFGSMYIDDMRRIYSLVHHNLTEASSIGFHSHNNLQMSSAISQDFVKITFGQRNAIVDSTVSGMGRGAGNTPTELIAQFLVSKFECRYNIDVILDVIDTYIDNMRAHCEWGYSTPFFSAGTFNAHVNNLTYLTQKASLQSKDIRRIVNLLDTETRKRYNYSQLENVYLSYCASNFNDSPVIDQLNSALKGRHIVMLAPGKSTVTEADRIQSFVSEHDAIVISINFFHENIKSDFLYFNNAKRYSYIKNDKRFKEIKKIVTSNISTDESKNIFVVSFTRLLKSGWENLDNSAILLLRLLDLLDVTSVTIAGLDGFGSETRGMQYADESLETPLNHVNILCKNKEIQSMLNDFFKNRKAKYEIDFITQTRFSKQLNNL